MYSQILSCPKVLSEVKKLTAVEQSAIVAQCDEFATDMYNDWVALASKQAQAMSNEDAYAYLFKQRRDKLIDIVDRRHLYSWRKRYIAGRILYAMGYDSVEHNSGDWQ